MNGAASMFPPQWLRVPAGLCACGLTAAVLSKNGVRASDMGLDPKQAMRGSVFGAIASLPIAIGMVYGASNDRAKAFYGEESIAAAPVSLAVYETCIRIPFGTALPEEIVFRGCLQALLARERSTLAADSMSSLLFGLWHVTPTLRRMNLYAFSKGRPAAFQVLWLAATVGATTVSGLALVGLRRASGSVVAPWIAHSTANGVGYMATWLASHKKAGRQTQR
ncbi:MAG TPA: CPBP family intramembrane glutamic endopeptidase [Dehalococcoidia bacterium]|nr:CPBP family intramembrane glutamic endopeptidase [Dehalococcoidia bacterium]